MDSLLMTLDKWYWRISNVATVKNFLGVITVRW